MDRPVIAIDGPAASGKGTLARKVAEAMGYALLDTGALYRGVALTMIRAKLDMGDGAAATATARSLTPADIDRLTHDPELRLDVTASGASRVSAVPGVRQALLDFQRHFAADPPGGLPGAVLDGRDIGTVICPAARVKLFVTASVEVRAQRRYAELQARGEMPDFAAVLADMTARDERDTKRAVAPLVPAADAVIIDNSTMSPAEVLTAALTVVRAKLSA